MLQIYKFSTDSNSSHEVIEAQTLLPTPVTEHATPTTTMIQASNFSTVLSLLLLRLKKGQGKCINQIN